MPFNGSGSFSLIFNWQQDALNNINISSSRMMGQENDIAAGLSLCLTKDGQQTPTANIPMGGFRFTNMGNANAQGNAVSVQDVQNGSVTTLTSVSGTDTITANTAPSIGSYAKGQYFLLFPAGANATTAVTLNVNGLGAKNITKNGANALAIGDIPASGAVPLYYDGTQFQIVSLPRGLYLGTQQFLSSGTYTPTPGTRLARFRGVASGAAGGGTAATGAAQGACGSGGSAGNPFEFLLANPTSQSITIGAAGTGVSGGAGGNGGDLLIGSIATIKGGVGGVAGTAQSTFPVLGAPSNGVPAASTISGTGVTVLVNGRGQAAVRGMTISSGPNIVSAGGTSLWGSGGTSDNNASGFGSGGTGTTAGASAAATTGGSGAPAILLIDEYA